MKRKRSYDRATPLRGKPLGAGSVYLVCRRSGRWVGDILVHPSGGTYPATGKAYAVGMHDCLGHSHVAPTDAEVKAALAEATRANASVPLRVSAAD